MDQTSQTSQRLGEITKCSKSTDAGKEWKFLGQILPSRPSFSIHFPSTSKPFGGLDWHGLERRQPGSGAESTCTPPEGEMEEENQWLDPRE